MRGSPAVGEGHAASSNFDEQASIKFPIRLIEINHLLEVRLLLGSSGCGHHAALCRKANGSSLCQLNFLVLIPPFFVCSQRLDESNKKKLLGFRAKKGVFNK